jgi:hypothetical protein
MAAEPGQIGSSEWWTATADKLIGFGMDVLLNKTSTKDTGGATGTTPGKSVSTSMLEGKLPYILGGLAVVGIAVILWKR